MNTIIMNGNFLIESIITYVLVCVTESPHYANLPSRGQTMCMLQFIVSSDQMQCKCISYYDCNNVQTAISHSNVTMKQHIYINNQTNTYTLSHAAGHL